MGRKPFYVKGALGDRPNARRLGLFYHDAGDDTIYVDDGSEWAQAGGGAVGAGSSPRLLSYNVFVPGTLRPLTIATMANPKIGGSPTLRYLEANLQSAPVGVDASNHIAARVAGSTAGSVDLAFNSGVSRFALDNASPIELAGQTSVDGSGGSQNGTITIDRFSVSSDMRVVGCMWAVGIYSNNPDLYGWAGKVRRAFLRDDNDTVLAVSDDHSDTGPTTSYAWDPDAYMFTEPVDLTAGTIYQIGLVFPNSSSASFGGEADTPNYFGGYSIHGTRHIDTGSGWSETTPLASLATHWSHSSRVKLLGNPTGDLIEGNNITLSLLDVGTPPSDPGADLNLTMRLEI